jgi:hypothetical protein
VGGIGKGVTATPIDAWALDPVGPVQVSVNVPLVESGALLSEPLVLLAPVHAPEATHAVALVDVQVSVVNSPVLTAVGLAEIVTVGGEGGAPTVT